MCSLDWKLFGSQTVSLAFKEVMHYINDNIIYNNEIP